MTWLNPWAWLGAAAIAVPVLVHLLARRRARPEPFPTLRFLDASRQMLARRDRLSDLALLAVRALIVIAAVAALAQPLLLTDGRQAALGRSLARAVIVDASASMQRRTAEGITALEAARRDAGALSAGADTSTAIDAPADLAHALPAAAAWLERQPGRRELVIVSDFQTGTITNEDLSTLPAHIGVTLKRIAVATDGAPGRPDGARGLQTPGSIEVVTATGANETTAAITLAPDQTQVAWTTRPSTSSTPSSPTLLAGSAERAAADAAANAARAFGDPPAASTRDVAIVYPGFEDRATIARDAGSLTAPWMIDVVSRLRQDSMLAAATRSAQAPPPPVIKDAPAPSGADRLTTILTSADGAPLVRAGADGARLLLFCMADAGSVTSAALIAATRVTIAPAIPASELDPSTVPDDVLRTWERQPGSIAGPGARDRDGVSDGRWLWAAALVLLGLETWMRRSRKNEAATEVEHARVA